VAQKHFILATAGHVDHGKSALVKALTGTDPDRLPEEKTRGITIDLGFAHLDLITAAGESLRIGIVDVPGHEDFVRNMIAGIGAIDLALLVVAADDGWMPQTEEHLQILLYLGVNRAVVVLTKSDLGATEAIAEDIRAQLRDTVFSHSPIVSTSVRTNQGLEQLKQALAAQFSEMQPQHDVGKPRLFVDRAFSLRGIGTVVTGTLLGGKVIRGDKVFVQPKKLEARIRSLQSHGADQEMVSPGTRTAINLPDLPIGKNATCVSRGDVVTSGNLGEPSAVLDVLVERSLRLRRTKSPAARPLRSGMSIQFHLGSAHGAARMFLLDGDTLGPGEKAIAQLRLASPVHAFLGDRFILRDASEQHTLAGGIVLDPDGDAKQFRTDAQSTFLRARADSAPNVDLALATELKRSGAIKRNLLLLKSSYGVDEITNAIDRFAKQVRAVIRPGMVADVTFWRSLRDRISRLIDEEHRLHPERSGIDVSQLRAANASPEVFDAVLADLCSDGFKRSGTILARASHQPTLPENLRAAGTKIRAALSVNPLDPPARAALAPDVNSQQALRFLVTTGQAIELGTDIVLGADSFQQLKNAVVDLLTERGAATASELRKALGNTRRVLIPLLERLDRDGVTRREGDRRVLRGS
jgi:selenocysteine-specific elongation factor